MTERACTDHRRPIAALWAATALAAAGAIGLSGLPAASPAGAAEVTPRPASGSLTIEGRGFGHGRGMSQWGAYGAAEAGLTWPQILDFYYPGTARTRIANSSIRIWISNDSDGSTSVVPVSGLTATVGRTVRSLPAGPGFRMWRAQRAGAIVSLSYLDAKGTWRPYRMPIGPDIVFRAPSGVVQVVLPGGIRQDLRGKVLARLDGTTVKTVLDSSMESYLRSVVPAEMPSSWNVEALGAQAVAARTYAAAYRDRQRAKGARWDICDTVSCQVFKGVARYTTRGTRIAGEFERTTKAVTATTGTVLRTSTAADAPFAFAEFSASNGGYTAAGGPTYQVAKPDPYDGRLANPSSRWTVKVPVTRLESALGVGTLQQVSVLTRDGRGALGGRVERLQVTGSKRSVTISGAKLRSVLGLRSDWFTIQVTPVPVPVPPAARRR